MGPRVGGFQHARSPRGLSGRLCAALGVLIPGEFVLPLGCGGPPPLWPSTNTACTRYLAIGSGEVVTVWTLRVADVLGWMVGEDLR